MHAKRRGTATTIVLKRRYARNAIDYATPLRQAFEALDADSRASVAMLQGTGGTVRDRRSAYDNAPLPDPALALMRNGASGYRAALDEGLADARQFAVRRHRATRRHNMS
ncbi:hypothetical protein IHE31_13185 [Mycetohabitans rhizoxinica]|uniref:hypothetical protein n=1 Tax=Mycetohabitans rhizoxinica TaxID=412963 RepID=UPI0030D35042